MSELEGIRTNRQTEPRTITSASGTGTAFRLGLRAGRKNPFTMGLRIRNYHNPLEYCSAAKFKFRALRRLHHSRKPIATRFQHKTATHATAVSDFESAATKRVTVARSN